jgi:ATP synthase regulation protein NCA2
VTAPKDLLCWACTAHIPCSASDITNGVHRLLQGMPGMAFMMDAYEQELKRPIRNVVNGQLPRTLLIQVQTM